MKTQLLLAPHSMLPDASVVEIWHDGHFMGTVVGADGPGVRIISKYQMTAQQDWLGEEAHDPPAVVTVTIQP